MTHYRDRLNAREFRAPIKEEPKVKRSSNRSARKQTTGTPEPEPTQPEPDEPDNGGDGDDE